MIAGPLRGREGVLSATIDLDDVIRGKYDLDVAGHYARPDVFSLGVDTEARASVSFASGPAQKSDRDDLDLPPQSVLTTLSD